MSIYGQEVVPEDKKGLENYIFTRAFSDVIYVYHNTEYTSPLGRRTVKGWLCCTEGWRQAADGKWHERKNCGFAPGRIAENIDGIFECYRAS